MNVDSSLAGKALLLLAAAAATAAALSGCAVAALAPVAVQGGSLVNGSTATKVQVTLDDKTFTPAVHDLLARSKTWAFAVASRADIRMVDALGTQGGFDIKVDRPAARQGELTTAERRDSLKTMCGSYKADVALLPRRGSTQTGNVWAAAFTGRADVQAEAWLDGLDCRAGSAFSFAYTIALDTGIWARQPKAQMEDAIASQVASTLLVALGKVPAPTASVAEKP